MLPSQVVQIMKNQQNNFLKMKNKIKDCSTDQESVWQPDKICLKRQKCFRKIEKPGFQLMSRPWLSYMRTLCPCDGEYGVECSEGFCGTEKRACDSLSLKISELDGNIEMLQSSIEKCSFMSF